MEVLTDIGSISRQEWLDLLTHSQYANWFQTPEAYHLFEINRDETRPFVVAIRREKEQRLVGIIVGYVTHVPCGLLQYFSSRAIIQSGPVLAEDIKPIEINHLFQAISRVLPPVIYYEVRAFADYSAYTHLLEPLGWHYIPHYDIIINCQNGYQERIHETKRRQIHKAIAEGEEWKEATQIEEVNGFYQLLRTLYRKKIHRPLFSHQFFIRAWETHSCHILVVKKNGKVTGGVFMPQMGDTAYEWYICGGVMATYAMMEYCAQQQLSILDTMGAGEPNKAYGVRDFKLQMGGELKEYGRYLCIRSLWRYKLGKTLLQLRAHNV